jgi:hypothetical protein
MTQRARTRSGVRRRLALGSVALSIGALIVFALGASPAAAHTALLDGETSCANGEHVITWSIGNDFDVPMAITSASAGPYAVSGYVSPVGPLGTTTASTIVPGPASGTVTLTVNASWSDGYTGTWSTSVSLEAPCVAANGSTTTVSSTAPATTSTPVSISITTAPASASPSTTVDRADATTSIPAGVIAQGSTLAPPPETVSPSDTNGTVASAAGATNGDNDGDSASLPFTGVNSFGPLLGGASLLVGVGALLYGNAPTRRRRD